MHRHQATLLSSPLGWLLGGLLGCTLAMTVGACGTTDLLLDPTLPELADTLVDSSPRPELDSFVALDSGTDTSSDTTSDANADSFVGRDSGFDSGIDTRAPSCPIAEPASSGACAIEGQSCGWNSTCGGVDRGTCSKGAWSIAVGPCPPPVSECPFPRPAPGLACTISTTVCVYGNACGAVSSARCESGKWLIADFPCKPDCPPAAPVPGTACPSPPPKSATCGYTFGPSCSFACLCWKDIWTCYGTPCPDPPTGSGLDGGTP